MHQKANQRSGIIGSADEVTPVVLAAMQDTPNSRLRELAAAFIRHMHAFAREVKLTEAEYDIGIDFINRIGQATHDSHNEGILFADCDLRAGLHAKRWFDAVGHYSRTDVLSKDTPAVGGSFPTS